MRVRTARRFPRRRPVSRCPGRLCATQGRSRRQPGRTRGSADSPARRSRNRCRAQYEAQVHDTFVCRGRGWDGGGAAAGGIQPLYRAIRDRGRCRRVDKKPRRSNRMGPGDHASPIRGTPGDRCLQIKSGFRGVPRLPPARPPASPDARSRRRVRIRCRASLTMIPTIDRARLGPSRASHPRTSS